MLLLLVLCVAYVGANPPATFNRIIDNVDLVDTRLLEGTWHYKQQRTSLEWMVNLDPDRLLYNFRHQAGLPQAPGARPYGGWEAPTCELRGHFVGHYMSATAFMWASTGNETVKAHMDYVVDELAKCQEHMNTGYLSAFPPSMFDKLEKHIYVWAPYYTIHKILAGLYDQYTHTKRTKPLQIASWMLSYFFNRVNHVLLTQGEVGWQQILQNEWGGMNEVAYNFYGVTKDKAQLQLGNWFDHYSWSVPLREGHDDLSPHHANTHIPEMIGYQRGYEVNNNITQFRMANNFIKFIQANHSWATGGSNTYEFWHTSANMGTQLALWTEESCTQYNILKVLRHSFMQQGEMALFDWYERGITNGIIGNQKFGEAGRYIYMLPMGGGGTHKGDNKYNGPSGYEHELYKINWGTTNASFWCCYGTLFESFSKLTDSIYFTSDNQTSLYIMQYMSSSFNFTNNNIHLKWSVSNITTHQTATLSFDMISPQRPTNSSFSIHIRVPHWISNNSYYQIGHDGKQIEVKPQQYITLKSGEWSIKDQLTVVLKAHIWVQPIRDDRPKWKKTYAIMYAHLILVGVTPPPHNTTKLDVDPALVHQYITMDETPTQPLSSITFTLRPPGERNITLMPFYEAMEQPYTVYWNQGPLFPPPTLEHVWGPEL